MKKASRHRKTSIELVHSIGDSLDVSFSLVNMLSHGQTLVYVNRHFTALTGYDAEECIGRNCRFLQGSETNVADVALVRRAILRRRTAYVDILNYTKDQTPFQNRLILFPLILNLVPHYAGLQVPITKQSLHKNGSIEFHKRSQEIKEKVSAQFGRIYAILDIKERIGKVSPSQTETLIQAFSNLVKFAEEQ